MNDNIFEEPPPSSSTNKKGMRCLVRSPLLHHHHHHNNDNKKTTTPFVPFVNIMTFRASSYIHCRLHSVLVPLILLACLSTSPVTLRVTGSSSVLSDEEIQSDEEVDEWPLYDPDATTAPIIAASWSFPIDSDDNGDTFAATPNELEMRHREFTMSLDASSSSTGSSNVVGDTSTSSTGLFALTNATTYGPAILTVDLTFNQTNTPQSLATDFRAAAINATGFPSDTATVIGQELNCTYTYISEVDGTTTTGTYHRRRLFQTTLTSPSSEVTRMRLVFIPADKFDPEAAIAADLLAQQFNCQDAWFQTKEQCAAAIAREHGRLSIYEGPMGERLAAVYVPGSVVVDNGTLAEVALGSGGNSAQASDTPSNANAQSIVILGVVFGLLGFCAVAGCCVVLISRRQQAQMAMASKHHPTDNNHSEPVEDKYHLFRINTAEEVAAQLANEVETLDDPTTRHPLPHPRSHPPPPPPLLDVFVLPGMVDMVDMDDGSGSPVLSPTAVYVNRDHLPPPPPPPPPLLDVIVLPGMVDMDDGSGSPVLSPTAVYVNRNHLLQYQSVLAPNHRELKVEEEEEKNQPQEQEQEQDLHEAVHYVLPPIRVRKKKASEPRNRWR